jgi:hypothetical protein
VTGSKSQVKGFALEGSSPKGERILLVTGILQLVTCYLEPVNLNWQYLAVIFIDMAVI